MTSEPAGIPEPKETYAEQVSPGVATFGEVLKAVHAARSRFVANPMDENGEPRPGYGAHNDSSVKQLHTAEAAYILEKMARQSGRGDPVLGRLNLRGEYFGMLFKRMGQEGVEGDAAEWTRLAEKAIAATDAVIEKLVPAQGAARGG